MSLISRLSISSRVCMAFLRGAGGRFGVSGARRGGAQLRRKDGTRAERDAAERERGRGRPRFILLILLMFFRIEKHTRHKVAFLHLRLMHRSGA